MPKILPLLLVCVTFALAQPFGGKYELYAPTLTQNGDETVAEGGVAIYSPDSTFSAQKVIYNQKTQILELIGDVYVNFQGKQYTKSDRLVVDLSREHLTGETLFLYDDVSDLWIKSRNMDSNKALYTFQDAAVSSCGVENPDWQFRFKKGIYDAQDEFITLHHTKLYFQNTPVFYLPWFAFPTSTKRRTGLLMPHIGFANGENFLFVQPFFFAPASNWDIELSPQIRLDRGQGLYGTLRFVDTNHSRGWVKGGFFSENSDYLAKYNLKNSTHQGMEIKYQNNAVLAPLFKNERLHDGVLVDYTNLNDIDYINLKHDAPLEVNKLVTSKLNYYMTDDNRYVGLYAKYFIDTEKLNNDDTLQTLPSVQYHQALKTTPIKNVLYLVDYKFKNNYRKSGLRATQHEMFIPLTFYKPIFDDYLNFSVSENLYYSRVNYFEGNTTTQNADYFRNYHEISLSSDLSKRYASFIHNMQLEASYMIPSIEHKNGYFADFIPFNLEHKTLFLKFNEYLYDAGGLDFLTHRVTQNIFLEEELDTFDDLENELIYKFSNAFSVRNSVVYSHAHDKLKKVQSGIYYQDESNSLRADHTYQNAPTVESINFLSADYGRILNKRYRAFVGLDYDFDEDFTKEWRVGLSMKKQCWEYQLRYKESVTPNLTSVGAESITRRGIYLFVRLANIGGVDIKSEKDFALGDTE